MKIGRELVVTEAMKLLSEVGLDQFTTRRLAERLGVQQPTLYYHFKNKQGLVDAMNAQIKKAGHTYRLPKAGDDWRSYLSANAKSFRNSLLSYRDGARVHAGSIAAEPDLPEAEAQLRCLVDAGFSSELALQILVTLSRFTVGSVLEQQAEQASNQQGETPAGVFANYPFLSAAAAFYWTSGYEDNFETGLALILDGAAARLDG